MKSLLLLLSLSGLTLTTRACDCLMTPIEHQIKSTPYLLTGQVLEILDGNTAVGRKSRSFRRSMNLQADTVFSGYTAKVRVQEDFKGRFKAGDIIEISSDFSNCAVLFEVGEQYVLFLHKEQDTLFTTSCSYSEKLSTNSYVKSMMRQIHEAVRKFGQR